VEQHSQWNQNTATRVIKCENLLTINVIKAAVRERFKHLHKQSVKIVLDMSGANEIIN
jgi:hypothetical protein